MERPLEQESKRRGLNWHTIRVLSLACIGSCAYGYAASIIATTLGNAPFAFDLDLDLDFEGQPSFIEYMRLDTRHNATGLLSATNGIYFAGGAIGQAMAPFIADKWGRKMIINIGMVALIVAGALQAGSVSMAMFLIARFISGWGAFVSLLSVPNWMGEVVPPALRGALIDSHAICLNIGYMSASWFGVAFYFWKDDNPVQWRPPLAFQCICPIVLLCVMPWIPESPRWLVMMGRHDEARAILEKLHSAPDDPRHEFALKEFYQIRHQLEMDMKHDTSLKSMFTKKSNLKRTLLGMLVTVLAQCSGVLVINAYGPLLYAGLGFDSFHQLLYSAAWVTLSFGCNVIGAFFVDSYSRPKFYSLGLLGCASCLVVEAAIVANFAGSDNQAALRAGVAMLFLFIVPYGLCIDGPEFTYIIEIFPTHLRAKGVYISFLSATTSNIMWTQVAPTAFKNIGWKFYLPFICITFVGGISLFFFGPDTNGLRLEEVAALFGDEEVVVYERDIIFDEVSHQVHAVNDVAQVTSIHEHEKSGKE